MRFWLSSIAALALTATALPAAAAYIVTDIGDFTGGDNRTFAKALNDRGQVVGVGNATGNISQAFRWTFGTGMVSLGDLPGGTVNSAANGINNRGDVVGSSSGASGFQAFLWTEGGGMQNLGDLPGGGTASSAFGINDDGLIVGEGSAATGPRAFIWENGVFTDLGDLPGGADQSSGRAINADGDVVGLSNNGEGFVYSNGVMTALSALPGIPPGASGIVINDLGVIGGTATTPGGATNGYLYDNGVTTFLNDLAGGSNFSYVKGINNAGDAVGVGTIGSGERGALWSGGTVRQIGGLISLPGWLVFEGVDINNRGQILINAYNSSLNATHAFLLTPEGTAISLVPEPASWAVMLLGFGAIGGALRTRRRSLAVA